MAVWQFKVMLVPEVWADRNRARLADYLKEDGWELGAAWRGCQTGPAIEELIDGVMARAETYADGLTIWGDVQGHDIQLYRSEAGIEDLQVRIDLREDPRPMLDMTVSLAEQLGCSLLVMGDAEVIPPSLEALARAALRSDAAAFVSGPWEFLAERSNR